MAHAARADYSKWDAIELSDDEDFECHPNVDKKSMIRWKQAQVHKERRERQDQYDLLKLEMDTTAKFLATEPDQIKKRFADLPRPLTPKTLGDTFKALEAEIEKKYTDPIRSESLSRINSWPREWESPNWGTVLREHVPWHESVAKISEEVAKAAFQLGASGGGGGDPESLVALANTRFDECFEKLRKRQPLIDDALKQLHRDMNKKLTVDHLKTGFDKTVVAKKPEEEELTAAPAADSAPSSTTSAATTSAKPAPTTKTIETINTPRARPVETPEKIADSVAAYPGLADEILSGFSATDQELEDEQPGLLAFSRYTDFGDVIKALKSKPKLMKESREEMLLMRALSLEIMGRSKEAKTAALNSLIIKYTRSLGASGIDVFFSRLQGGKTSAHTMFFSDVEKTYEHIQKRGKVLREERMPSFKRAAKEKAEHEAKIREIYESFLQPDGSLVFPMPENPSERFLERAKWFNELPHYAKEGLLLEDIDKINQFLGTLTPEEAERNAQFAIEAGFIQTQSEEDQEGQQQQQEGDEQ
ncbi:hsp90 co-chaperone Cdc37 [Polyrhizophydium stewartii]|uniref:Hsp90 chaperone protein kinase-targeting subunit n=1 Tax=Polyrhizophydium stewartii TaxID=2732419 RepID=A0ABR4N2B9_9FUNG|nr:hsp90 co-chaperone Cdc37 [Polyrhizophydium stewartii]